MKIIDWLKIIGCAVLIEIILVALSFAEVFIWSALQTPTPTNAMAEQHAKVRAPWVSAICGLPVMYIFSAFLIKKKPQAPFPIALGLPTVYLLLDIAILLFFPVDWAKEWPVTVGAMIPKYIGAMLPLARIRRDS